MRTGVRSINIYNWNRCLFHWYTHYRKPTHNQLNSCSCRIFFSGLLELLQHCELWPQIGKLVSTRERVQERGRESRYQSTKQLIVSDFFILLSLSLSRSYPRQYSYWIASYLYDAIFFSRNFFSHYFVYVFIFMCGCAFCHLVQFIANHNYNNKVAFGFFYTYYFQCVRHTSPPFICYGYVRLSVQSNGKLSKPNELTWIFFHVLLVRWKRFSLISFRGRNS